MNLGLVFAETQVINCRNTHAYIFLFLSFLMGMRGEEKHTSIGFFDHLQKKASEQRKNNKRLSNFFFSLFHLLFAVCTHTHTLTHTHTHTYTHLHTHTLTHTHTHTHHTYTHTYTHTLTHTHTCWNGKSFSFSFYLIANRLTNLIKFSFQIIFLNQV